MWPGIITKISGLVVVMMIGAGGAGLHTTYARVLFLSRDRSREVGMKWRKKKVETK